MVFNLGIELYEDLIESRKLTLENFIEKYGQDKGIEKWNKYIEKQVKSHLPENGFFDIRLYFTSREGYIEYYGPELGEEKWKDRIRNTSLRFTTDINKIKDSGLYENPEEEALRRFLVRSNSHTLDRYIERFGKEEGSRRFNSFISKSCRGSISKVSEEFLDKVSSELYGIVDMSDLIYGRLIGEKYQITGYEVGDINKFRRVDFFIEGTNIAIEFQGSYWHPKITEDDLIEFSIGCVKNLEILNELSKRYSLSNLGYNVLYIEEYKYYKILIRKY